MNSIWALLGIAICAAGCVGATVETTHLNEAPHPLVPRSTQSVEIYSSAPPTRPHVDVALLRADQGNYEADTARMVQALAERAGQLGCDALFISGASERPGAPGNAYLFDPGSRALLGTCIVYRAQPPEVALAAPPSDSKNGNAILLVPPQDPKPNPSANVKSVAVGRTAR